MQTRWLLWFVVYVTHIATESGDVVVLLRALCLFLVVVVDVGTNTYSLSLFS